MPVVREAHPGAGQGLPLLLELHQGRISGLAKRKGPVLPDAVRASVQAAPAAAHPLTEEANTPVDKLPKRAALTPPIAANRNSCELIHLNNWPTWSVVS